MATTGQRGSGGTRRERLGPDAERRYVHRGQELTRDNLRRAPVVVCPKCLAEDSAAAPQTRPPVAASQRVRWQALALQDLRHPPHAAWSSSEKDMIAATMHDWSHSIGKVLPDLLRLIAAAGTRPAHRLRKLFPQSYQWWIGRLQPNRYPPAPRRHHRLRAVRYRRLVRPHAEPENHRRPGMAPGRRRGLRYRRRRSAGHRASPRRPSGPTPTRAPLTRVRRPSSAAATKFSSSVARTWPTSRC